MTVEPEAEGAPRPLADEGAQGHGVLGLGEQERDAMLAWVGENLTLVRRSASGQRPMYWILGTVLAVGLAFHVGGFLLKTSATTEPLMRVPHHRHPQKLSAGSPRRRGAAGLMTAPRLPIGTGQRLCCHAASRLARLP